MPEREPLPSGSGAPTDPAERRLAAEQATALVLAECSTLREAAPRLLQGICERLGWEHGALWMVDTGADRLRCVDVWHEPSVSLPEFESISRTMTFARGVGLPGRIWASASPAWIDDVVRDSNFPRAPSAARDGLHAAFGVPILLHGEVLGVLEFFSREFREHDEGLLRMLATIGSQIGLFVERRRAQDELDRFFTLSRDLFCIAGFDGFFRRLNPMWTKVLGYELEDLTARPYFDLVHPDDRESTLAEARRIEEGADTLSFENRYRCKDGSYRWLQWAATPYRDERVIYAAARDITDRKATEAQLEATRRDLQQNAENLAQLVKELEVARHRAEDATRAKGEFLANMSHEIRTPLTAIVGMTELALGTRLTAEQRDYLETLKASSDALLTIVNDVLDFSKIEARHLELEHVAFGLRDTVEDAMQLMAFRAQEKNLELACNVDAAAPDALVGDPGRLRQVIVNLVGNALKFTARGEIVLSVTVQTGTADHVRLRFAIADTGIGIPRDKHQAIFEAFAQADSSTTRRYGGTGLGLAIASQLVQMMGGRIWLESAEGRGSTFYFDAEFERAAPERDREHLEPVDVHGLCVLVVDDNATNRQIVSEMLGSWHMRPAVTDGGHEALRMLTAASATADPFRLVVLDGQMPEMDGFELARRIKHDRRFAKLPLIMLTSMGRPGDPARSRKIGISAYLTKPVKHSDLLDAIVTLCGTERRDPDVSERAARPDAPAAVPRSAGAGGAAASGGAHADAAAHSPGGATRRRLRILLAEDNAVNRKLVQSVLRKRGHALVAVENGRDAVRAIVRGARPYDLVLMDVQMPEMGGLEAATAIREHERTTGAHVPIVAMTARAMSGDREQCLRAGMDDYLSKPIHADRLLEAVERFASPPQAVKPASRDEHGAPEVTRGGLDLRLALARVNGDAQLLREVARLFLDDYPRLLATLRRAVQAHDAAGVQQAAHALKGSVAIFGATDAVERALALQRMGEAGVLTGAGAALSSLESRLTALESELGTLAGRARAPRRKGASPQKRVARRKPGQRRKH